MNVNEVWKIKHSCPAYIRFLNKFLQRTASRRHERNSEVEIMTYRKGTYRNMRQYNYIGEQVAKETNKHDMNIVVHV